MYNSNKRSFNKPNFNNITNNEGIKTIKELYDKNPNKTIQTKVITTFLSYLLTLTNFLFNLVNNIQNMGCAMGTICAPSYPNLFMAYFEEENIYS